MNRWVLTALVLSLALNIGFGLAWFTHQRVLSTAPGVHRSLHAEGRGPGSRRFHDGDWARGRASRLHRELRLDPHRRDQLLASLEPLEPEISQTRRELSRTRRDFARALHVAEPDRAQVMLLRKELSRLQAQLDSLVVEALLREAEVLPPEERERFGPWPLLHEERSPNEEMRR